MQALKKDKKKERPKKKAKPAKRAGPNRYPRLSKEGGGAAVQALAKTYNDYRAIRSVRTGIHAVDLAIGDGIPRGRFIEVVGDPSAFKSAFGYNVIAAFQNSGGIAALFDEEAKADKKFAEMNGVKWDDMIYIVASSIEDLVLKMEELIDKIRAFDSVSPIVIVWDSIGGTPSINELEDENLKTSEMAVRARLIASAFRRVIHKMHARDVTLIGINHMKTKIGIVYGPKMDSPGGRAVKYHSSVRILFGPGRRIQVPPVQEGKVVGVMGWAQVIKNNVGPPFRKADLRFFWEDGLGFDEYYGLAELLATQGRFKFGKPGFFIYENLKFRAKDVSMIASKRPEILKAL